MGLMGKIGVALAIVTLGSSCVRFELDELDQDTVEASSNALRISSEDSVVLCPLAAAVEPSGNVSIVWAGYPAGDDRLQLMQARVSSEGVPLDEPTGLALLDEELALLTVHGTEEGLEVRGVQRYTNQILQVELSESGRLLSASLDEPQGNEVESAVNALGAQRCDFSVRTADMQLEIRRTQVDGELPLFIENYPR